MSGTPALDPGALRVFVYDRIVDHAHVPTSDDIGAHFGVAPADARRALGALRIGKTVLVHPDTGEIWMAGPFSAAPTPYRVTVGRRTWWANCAWDMLGIVVIVGEAAEVDARCTDCGEEMPLRVDPRTGPAPDAPGIVHFLVPAGRWYEDIGFT